MGDDPLEDMRLILHGLGGELCSIHARPHWAVTDVKAAVEASIGIRGRQQRLLLGARELRDCDRISELIVESPTHVTLIKRPPQQVEWLELVEEDWSNLLSASPDAWADDEVVLAVVERCGVALQHAAEPLRADRRIVLAAVRQAGLALQHAAPVLAADREVALEAAAECGRALEFASEELQRDRDFVLEAVKRNGRVLEHSLQAFRADREVVLAAVTNSGPALASASADLRGDFEIVSAAVQQDHGAIIFASSKLRVDFDIQQQCMGRRAAPVVNRLPETPPARDGHLSDEVAFFSRRQSRGHIGLSGMLGREAALMCEIGNLGLPIVPGFCFVSSKSDARPPDLTHGDLKEGLAKIEAATECQFGSADAPLLLSVHASVEAKRSAGALCVSNLGLNDEIVSILSERWQPRCVLDCYRRLIYGFASVVKGLDMRPFDEATAAVIGRLDSKCQLGRKHEVCDIPKRDLQDLVDEHRLLYEEQVGAAFPQDPKAQLAEALAAILAGDARQGGDEAQVSRAIVQATVYGNFGAESGVTVVTTTQSSNSHLADMSGEWLPNAQYEDIRQGARQTMKLTIAESRAWAAQSGIPEEDRCWQYPSMEEKMPAAFSKLMQYQSTIASRFPHMEEAHRMVYVLQQGRLWIVRPGLGEPRSKCNMVECRRGPSTSTFSGTDCSSSDSSEEEALAMMQEIEDVEHATGEVLDTCEAEMVEMVYDGADGDIGSEDVVRALPTGLAAAPEPAAATEQVVGDTVEVEGDSDMSGTADALAFHPLSDPIELLDTSTASAVVSWAYTGMAGMWLANMAKAGSVLSQSSATAVDGLPRRSPTTQGYAQRRLPAAAARAARRRRPRDAAPPSSSPASPAAVVDDGEGPAAASSWWQSWQAPSFRLPVWQTAFAGGLAGVATQMAAGNSAACKKALPTGAICCTLYVNLLGASSETGDLDSVAPGARLACAGMASSIAIGTMHVVTTAASRVPGASIVLGLGTAVKNAMPAMAIEMTTIDVAKRALVEKGEKVSPGVLLLAGGVAGFVSQTILYPLGALASGPRVPTIGEAGLAKAASEGCSKALAKGRARPLAPVLRQLGPRLRRSVPGAAANSVTRVGLVTQFLDAQGE